jgi:predicted amidohydrolase YtcJ
MKRVLLAALVLAPLAYAAEPSMILLHGKVFTADPAKPSAEAVAIEGNRIAAVGTDAEIGALRGEKTKVIDVHGATIIPGINDAHTHPVYEPDAFQLSAESRDPHTPDPNWSAISTALAATIDETPADLWIVAKVGPTILLDPQITAAKLDKIAPGRKVALEGWTGHGLILSSEAMKAVGIAPDAKDPNGGWYDRDAAGHINGRTWEYAAMAADMSRANAMTDDEIVLAIRDFASEALQYGITSVQAMSGVSAGRFAADVRRANVPLRIRVINFNAVAAPFTPPEGTNGVKWILDGTPIEQNAAVRTPYRGGGKGRLNFTNLAPLVKTAVDAKQQLLLHVAGDAAVAQALDALAATKADWPALRPRFEHGDGLSSDLIPAAKRLGVIVVQNPSHFGTCGAYGPGEYCLAATLVKNGIPFALGSDGPLNPYLNILLAADRRDAKEALTREDAVRAYTTGSAYAEFAEKEKGMLAKGMLADLAVLSQDIFSARLDALPETKSVLTIVNGQVAYSELPIPEP